MGDLGSLSAAELLDLQLVARAVGFPAGVEALETAVSPRGLPAARQGAAAAGLVVDRLVEHFGGLQKLLAAGIDDLQPSRASARPGRAASGRPVRLAESSILERYV
jgi:diadenylate cyclase